MKKCANCGFESPDEATSCPSCTTDTFVTESPEALGHIISPAEQSYWGRMTFRQFAVLFIRVQALWLFFNAVVEASYLVDYFSPQFPYFSFTFHAKMLVARVALHVAAGIFCLRYADRIISWLVKDIVPRMPPNSPPVPGGTPPVDPTKP